MENVNKNLTLVCFLLPLKRENKKMSDTYSLFPLFGDPWTCLLPSQYQLESNLIRFVDAHARIVLTNN